jgi:hypothetical protein
MYYFPRVDTARANHRLKNENATLHPMDATPTMTKRETYEAKSLMGEKGSRM